MRTLDSFLWTAKKYAHDTFKMCPISVLYISTDTRLKY